MMKKRNLLIRAIEGAETGGSSAPANTETPAETVAAEQATPAAESNDAGSVQDGEEDGDGRGSKRAVLADLARERSKRHELESELAKMREENSKNAIATDKVAELAAQLEELQAERRELQIKTVLSETGLPAEMANRLRGNTLDELKADADSLAKVFNASAGSDPTQGRGNSPQPKTMADALAAHYS